MNEMVSVTQAYDAAVAATPPGRPVPAHVVEARWLIEEFRVSLWAQELGTSVPVSAKRILKVLTAPR